MYEKSLWTLKGEKKACAAINVVDIPTISKQPYLKADFLSPEAHITSKDLLVMDLILIFLSKKVDAGFLKTLNPAYLCLNSLIYGFEPF